jgi:hypothetical protein
MSLPSIKGGERGQTDARTAYSRWKLGSCLRLSGQWDHFASGRWGWFFIHVDAKGCF